MPYSYPDKIPRVAQNWDAESQRKCTDAAQAALQDGASEDQAIFACIHAAGKSKREEKMSDNMTLLDKFINTANRILNGDEPFAGMMPDGTNKGATMMPGQETCEHCRQYTDGKCALTGGEMKPGDTCEKWEPMEKMSDASPEAFYVPIIKGDDGVLIFPLGKFYRDGRWREFTADAAAEMVRNFKDGVIGREPPINKEHKREDGRIARIVDLYVAEDGVRGKLNEVAGYEGALRGFDYLSPEVRWEWTHPETGKAYKNVLFGAAATNYPFFLGKMGLHGEPAPVAKSMVWDGNEWKGEEEMSTENFQETEREKLNAARDARAKRYGIGVKEGGALTPPKGYPADEGMYGDPVNYSYPADRERAMPAMQYFNHAGQREAGGYTPEEWSIIGKRIATLAGKALGVDYQYRDGHVERKRQAEAASEPATPEAFVHEAPFVAADEAQRIVYSVVLQPGIPDAQNHIMAPEEIEAACHRFAEGLQLDKQHRRLVQADEARVVENWIQREPAVWHYGDQETEIAPGSWCMGIKFYSDELWADVLEGRITGLSPRGKGLLAAV